MLSKREVKLLLGQIKLGGLYLSEKLNLAKRGAKWIEEFNDNKRPSNQINILSTLIEIGE